MIPEESYSPELLHPKALDMASDFINQCGAQGFHIEYVCTFVCLFLHLMRTFEQRFSFHLPALTLISSPVVPQPPQRLRVL